MGRALKKEDTNISKPQKGLEDALELIKKLTTPELVIGLCGPIGSPLNKAYLEFYNIFDEAGYTIHEIKMSSFIVEYFPFLIKENKTQYEQDFLDKDLPKFDQKKRKIEIGNELRKRYGSTILAECAIKQISIHRQKHISNGSEKPLSPEEIMKRVSEGKRVVFIINSIKNQAELDLLKNVYRDIFYMIGITSSISDRENYLGEENGMSKSQVWELFDKETGEEIKHGQTVKDTFPQADYFISISPKNTSEIKSKIERFFRLVFSTRISIPTIHETAMYIAAASSWNSACLSRQVGAVLTDESGEILSVGWNDVPIYGGGLYQEDKDRSEENTDSLFYNKKYEDKRCFNLVGCYNDSEKNKMSKKIVETLKAENLLNKNEIDYVQKAENAIRQSKISSLVEFSRSIHAEMHAIISGCISSGNRIKNGRLYITTYPCHMCARHIILVGIKEVFYIEPYKKSLTTYLHEDSITDDEEVKQKDAHKVHIKQFEGVGPTRYMQLFKMTPNSRKEKLTGQLLKKEEKSTKAIPKNSLFLAAIPSVEGEIAKKLQEKVGADQNLENE